MKELPEMSFLNYHHLRYFWSVAREGSLRKASEKLRISQPSISTQIGLLEESLGENLFRPRGRSMELTEFGQRVFSLAEEIFTLGEEVLRAGRQAPSVRTTRLHAGVVDSFPKLMSHQFLLPVLRHEPAVCLTCHEGKLADLVSMLSTHRLDVVLSDEPASPGILGKVFNHLLGSSDITFCAMPALARTLKGKFPRNLDAAPALLPTHNCSMRRDLERWFSDVGVQPQTVAEFEDAALAKIVASDGLGVIAMPTAVVADAVERHGFQRLGRTRAVETRFYAITAESRFIHPALQAIISSKPRTAAGKKG